MEKEKLIELKKGFDPYFPEWLKKILRIGNGTIYPLLIFTSLIIISIFSKFILILFAGLCSVYVILSVFGLVLSKIDNYRILKICSKNGITVEDWNNTII